MKKPKKNINIVVLLGTLREGRMSERVAKFVLTKLKENKEIKTTFIDVRDLNFSHTDEGPGPISKNRKWKNAIVNADGLIIITPEYNRGYPGSLKYALDMMLKEYIHKPVAVCGVSSGRFAGVRVIESLLSVLRELGLVVTFTDLNIGSVKDTVKEDGTVEDERVHKQAEAFITELIWMAKSLRYGRESIPSKYHKK
jgi:NAD(P)H-dependent FMN reductase